MCPYYLDGDQVQRGRRLLADAREGPGDTRFQPPLIVAADVALCSFQGPPRGAGAVTKHGGEATEPSGLSKLNSTTR